jgi:hypothetical protein
VGAGEGVEERGLAHIGQPDDAGFEHKHRRSQPRCVAVNGKPGARVRRMLGGILTIKMLESCERSTTATIRTMSLLCSDLSSLAVDG